MGSKEINLHGIMIVRNGCVLAETMTYPYQKKLWHATYSLCKRYYWNRNWDDD